MDTIPETFNSYFARLYNKKTYLDKYGGSVIATTVTLFFFFCISQAKKLVISPEMAIFFPTLVGLSYGANLFRKLDWNS